MFSGGEFIQLAGKGPYFRGSCSTAGIQNHCWALLGYGYRFVVQILTGVSSREFHHLKKKRKRFFVILI